MERDILRQHFRAGEAAKAPQGLKWRRGAEDINSSKEKAVGLDLGYCGTYLFCAKWLFDEQIIESLLR